MQIQLIRHATLLIQFNEQTWLVDPIFSDAESMEPVPGVPNTRHNPLVDLSVPISTLLNVDAILLTHLHRDHFDAEAASRLSKLLPIFCQPNDEEIIRQYGFQHVHPISSSPEWKGIALHRTGGQHGTGEIAQKMGPVSGFVLEAANEPSLYISGDTVWCAEVEQALQKHSPDVIVCFAGEARFSEGPPITMTTSDIQHVGEAVPHSRIIAVHMEAWNHCHLSRQELHAFAAEHALSSRLFIPADGETLTFTK